MRRIAFASGLLLIALANPPAWAQAQKKPAPAAAPAPAPAPAAAPVLGDRNAPLYFYLADPAGNRVLLQTKFTLDNQEADIRVLRRFYGVLAGLNQKGFRKNDKLTITTGTRRRSTRSATSISRTRIGQGQGHRSTRVVFGSVSRRSRSRRRRTRSSRQGHRALHVFLNSRGKA